MAAYEARLWQDVSRTVLIGEKDRAAIAAACRAQGQPEIDNVVWGPHGVDVTQFQPRPEAEEADSVVCRASCVTRPMSRPPCGSPSRSGHWCVPKWPDGALLPGRARSRRRGAGARRAERDHRDRHGEDPADWIARATVCVAPIRAAAGLQNKLLEAMAMAKAVVATPVANEGIRAPEGEALLLAQDPGPFAEQVLALLGDAALRQRLGVAARAFVEAKWTWEGPFLELEQAFLATGR